MVLDRSGALAPFGVQGELAIRQNFHTGAGIRTGYLARFSPQHGFEMTGLASHSVRLRGSRLGLGDLESCLYQNPEIAAAEATLLRGPENTPILAVYVTGRGGRTTFRGGGKQHAQIAVAGTARFGRGYPRGCDSTAH